MSFELFRRKWKVQVDLQADRSLGLDVSNLDIEFKILSTIKQIPNKCVLTVWNMNQDHRAALIKRNQPDPGKKVTGVPVSIEAGYEGNTSVLFSGDLREVGSKSQGPDWVSTLSGDDGGRSYRETTVNVQFAKGTPVATILTQLCDALSIGTGNAGDFTASAQINGMGSTITGSMSFYGSASKAMTQLTRSMGLTWSIQKGAIQLLKVGQPLNMGAVDISADTGLIGSPEASVDATVSLGNPQQFKAGAKQTQAKSIKPKDPGILKLKTMLIPGLIPGRKINLKSQQFNGGYYLTECEYVGQTFGNDWLVNSVARIY